MRYGVRRLAACAAVVFCGALPACAVIVSFGSRPMTSVLYAGDASSVSDGAAAVEPARPKAGDELFAYLGFQDGDRRSVVPLVKDAYGKPDTSGNKEYIYDRMLNTADYFSSVKGTFERDIAGAGKHYTVQYAVRTGEVPKTMDARKNGNGTVDFSCYDGVTRRLAQRETDGGRETFTVIRTTADPEDTAESDFVSRIKSTSRNVKDRDGVCTCYYRENADRLCYARESVFPQEMTMGCLSDFALWDIAGMDTVAGRECFVIAGRLNRDFAKKQNAASFRLWADTETGILLKYEVYDGRGGVTDRLTTSSVVINGEVTDRDFQILGEDDFDRAAQEGGTQ